MSRLNSAWRVVESVHPVTRAALQVIIDDYESKLSRLRELHAPKDYVFKLGTLVICSVCNDDKGNTFILYPCPTIRALDGDSNVSLG